MTSLPVCFVYITWTYLRANVSPICVYYFAFLFDKGDTPKQEEQLCINVRTAETGERRTGDYVQKVW